MPAADAISAEAPASAPVAGRSVHQVPRVILTGLFVFAGLWVATLIGLVIVSANPVTLSPIQIAVADVVVQVRPEPADNPREFVVIKAWKTNEPLEKIAIQPLPNSEIITWSASPEWLIPLTRTTKNAKHEQWEVTQGWMIWTPPRKLRPNEEPPGPAAHVRPLVYPATPAALSQLQALLAHPPGER